jgi:hypothetical protein
MRLSSKKGLKKRMDIRVFVSTVSRELCLALARDRGALFVVADAKLTI